MSKVFETTSGHHGLQRPEHGAATIPQTPALVHRAADLEVLFQETFFHRYQTVLEGGFDEPLYIAGDPARIHYTRDYFRSALHEVAHWCVAGPRRRRLDDYGYWYAPDGRDAAAQAEFLRVEVRPQALEALFCAASGHRFRVSVDNLDGDPGDEARFATNVRQLANRLLQEGLPSRPHRWINALTDYYQTANQTLATNLAQTFQA